MNFYGFVTGLNFDFLYNEHRNVSSANSCCLKLRTVFEYSNSSQYYLKWIFYHKIKDNGVFS